MGVPSFIAGDWGTTHLRLFLCDPAGQLLERKVGPGAVAVRGEFATVFDALTADWMERSGRLPAILCGMAGSKIGWRQTPYVPAPTDPAQLAAACVALRAGAIRIVPGLSCRNRFDAPDLMRGEETQVLGALQLQPHLARGRHLLCLPGTHTKWVIIEEGVIAEFLTVPTGELFDLVCRHSVLVDQQSRGRLDIEAFERAVAEFARYPSAQLMHRLFQCRSRWLTADLRAESTASFLSGLLIACDLEESSEVFAASSIDTVHVIGAAPLAHLYARAFAARKCTTRCIDGERASLAGLAHLHDWLGRAHGER